MSIQKLADREYIDCDLPACFQSEDSYTYSDIIRIERAAYIKGAELATEFGQWLRNNANPVTHNNYEWVLTGDNVNRYTIEQLMDKFIEYKLKQHGK